MFDLLHISSPVTRGYFYFLLIILVGEMVFHLLFWLVKWSFALREFGTKSREVFKGIIERLMLSVGIAHGIPTVVIAFGALKVATKLSLSSGNDSEVKINN